MQIVNKFLYNKALKLATKAHKGQKRWNGDDYITHPIRIADCFIDYKLKIIAILHDVIEDTDVTARDLIKYFSKEIVNAVIVLTQREPYANYIYNVKRLSSDACKVKIQDLIDNLEDLKLGHHRDKYELALFYLRS